MIKPAFALESVVYLKTDPEWVGMVTGLIQRPKASAYSYFVSFGSEESMHFECELTADRVFSGN